MAFNTNTSSVVPVNFGTFLVARSGVFDVRDHQFSGRYDQSLGPRDDIYFRYLFDDLSTPRFVGGAPAEVGFADFGLYPEYRTILRQRTQSLGMFTLATGALVKTTGDYNMVIVSAGVVYIYGIEFQGAATSSSGNVVSISSTSGVVLDSCTLYMASTGCRFYH